MKAEELRKKRHRRTLKRRKEIKRRLRAYGSKSKPSKRIEPRKTQPRVKQSIIERVIAWIVSKIYKRRR